MIQRLAVVGLGLIGGSFARALRSAGEVGSIIGYDADAAQRETALRNGVVDRVAPSAAAAVAEAQLVLIAVPVLRTAEVLGECLPALRSDAVVTDVGSTKQSVLQDVAAVCGILPPWFVAGHPIAGTEKSGVAHSFGELFRGRRVVLTPHAQQDPAALALVARLWRAVGARVMEMEAEAHDAVFAATSHLPHLLAYSFVDMLTRRMDAETLFANAGGGFRDFTRIASSSPRMWHDIMRANAPAVRALLAEQIAELQALQDCFDRGDWPELLTRFSRAKQARDQHLSQIE